MKAILIGATGATGSELLHLLLADNTVNEVMALVRRPLPVQHPKLRTEVINFDEPQTWKHFVTGDVAFSCLGTTLKAAGSKEAQYKVDYTYQYSFAKAAKENGVPKFLLVSASSASPKSVLFYSRMKGELEVSVRALDFESLTIFRPGLLSRPQTDRSGEKLSESILNFFNRVGLLKKLAPLPVHKLARLMLVYAKHNKTGEQIIEAAAILEEVKGL
ncbi:MAG TPA: NAD(P)H-binding protein [Parafilimonas sp.]|nr:NAD(P)H-binding protein [Parafilimonas sp.]